MRTKHEIVDKLLQYDTDDEKIPTTFEISIVELLADIRDALVKNNQVVEKPEVFSLQEYKETNMETPKIKRVEEEFGKPQLIHSPHHAHAQSWPDRNETIIQDRASLHASLVAAVEGKRQIKQEHCPECRGDGYTVDYDPSDPTGNTPMQVQCLICEATGIIEIPNLEYNQALDDTLTIINSIFKE